MEHNFFLSAFLAPKQIGKPFLVAVEPDPNHFPKKQMTDISTFFPGTQGPKQYFVRKISKCERILLQTLSPGKKGLPLGVLLTTKLDCPAGPSQRDFRLMFAHIVKWKVRPSLFQSIEVGGVSKHHLSKQVRYSL